MKTITIKQPWASLIVEGVKDIENRKWPTKFRGRVLIHAAAYPVKCIPSNLLNSLQYAQVFTANKLAALNGPNGAIIGSVEIVDCVINHPSVWAEKSFDAYVEGLKEPIKSVKVYNWVLAKPVKFDKPIENVKGCLNFWEYELPEEYLQEIERKLKHE